MFPRAWTPTGLQQWTSVWGKVDLLSAAEAIDLLPAYWNLLATTISLSFFCSDKIMQTDLEPKTRHPSPQIKALVVWKRGYPQIYSSTQYVRTNPLGSY